MKNIFKLIYKDGPHGDQMTNYTISFSGEPTLGEFLENVIQNKKDEWGEIYAYYGEYDETNVPKEASEKSKEKFLTIHYKNGQIKEITDGNIYNRCPIEFTNLIKFLKFLNKKIDLTHNNWANGGWSYMGYYIQIYNYT